MTLLPALKGGVSNLWVSGVIVLILLISVFFYSLMSPGLLRLKMCISHNHSPERNCATP